MKLKESQTIEFKISTSELKDALKDLCAFANTGTGTIYFGIRDDGSVIGQEISDKTIQHVTTDILIQIEPRLYPTIEAINIAGRSVLKVDLKNTSEKPYFLKGKAYKRVGSSNAYLSRNEIEKMMYERDNPAFHYDKSPLPGYAKGLNEKRLTWLLGKAQNERNLPTDEFTSQRIILEKLGVLSEKHLNIAGVLAFGRDITAIMPTAYIKCAVFNGLDKTSRILDHQNIAEDVFRQIDLAENFILRNIRKSAEVNEQTGRRESRHEIPYLAIREAIANAVAHRDYRLSSTIDVAIFDDRIEIWSPGTLPQGMTLELLHKDHASVLRNPVLAELLYLTGYIEHWGTGIRNMKTWMEEYGLPEPEYKEISTHFITILMRKKIATQFGTKSAPSWHQVGTKLALSWHQVHDILTACKEPVDLLKLMSLFGWKDKTKFRNKYINPLIQDGLITMTIPEKPKSSKQQYVITDKGTQVLNKNGS